MFLSDWTPAFKLANKSVFELSVAKPIQSIRPTPFPLGEIIPRRAVQSVGATDGQQAHECEAHRPIA